ncbi:hypothetical protein BH23GEM6_BH23GEM6_16540 [soil metagenome]
MLEDLRQRISDRWTGAEDEDTDDEISLDSLRVLAAELLLVTGVGATLDVLSRSRQSQRDRIPGRANLGDAPLAAVWGPALVAPFAAASHLRQAAGPSEKAARASRFLDTALIGIGVAEFASSLTGLQKRTPSLVPLALASAGLLGLVVARREREEEREHRALEKRAEIVARLVPKRRPKLDRIVVHV